MFYYLTVFKQQLNIIVFVFSISFGIFGQIIVDEDKADEVTPGSNTVSNYAGSEFYIGLAPSYTFRMLLPNEGFFGKELGFRANEEGTSATSFYSGLRTLLDKNIVLDLGLGWSINKEYFLFESADSLYEYTNSYRNVAFPLQIGFQSGGRYFSFLGTFGVIPKSFLSVRTDLRYKPTNSLEREEVITEKEGYNKFLIDAIANIGARMELNENYGFYILANGFYQFTSNYEKQGPYIRNPYGIGVHFGLHFYL